MTFDEAVGEGAWDSLTAFLTFTDNAPMLFEGEMTTEGESPWPSAGTWKIVNVAWSDATQQLLFKDGTMYWTDGLCLSSGVAANTERICTPAFLSFLGEYITEQRIYLADENLIAPFLRVGFEVASRDDEGITLYLVTSETSRMVEFVNWVEGGSVPAEEPEWRTSVSA
jgi:hypothetical protein